MRLLLLICFTAGCSPVIDAQLRLLDSARKGLASVGQSLDDRQKAMAVFEASERTRLDQAFDADAHSQSLLTDAWVIEARTAYAATLDAFARRRQQGEAAAANDQANLAAVDAALQQLQALGRAQQNLLPEQLK